MVKTPVNHTQRGPYVGWEFMWRIGVAGADGSPPHQRSEKCVAQRQTKYVLQRPFKRSGSRVYVEDRRGNRMRWAGFVSGIVARRKRAPHMGWEFM